VPFYPLAQALALAATSPKTLDAAIRGMIQAAAAQALTGVAMREGLAEHLAAFGKALAARRAEAVMLGAESVVKAAEKAAANAGGALPTIMPSAELPAVAPTRAVAAILKRTPRLAKTSRQVAMMYRHEIGTEFGAVEAVRSEVLAKVQGAIASGLKEGVAEPTVRDVVQDLTGWSRGYATTVARTNTMSAYADGEFAVTKDEDVADLVVGFEVVGPVDGDARPNHKALVGFRAAPDDPRWATLRPPLGFNCLLAGTVVEGRFLGASKARYAGPVVDVETRGGRRLSMTVNHPVLTERGWLRAGDLYEGANLLCHGEAVKPLDAGDPSIADVFPARWAVDHKNPPARVEDAYQSIAEQAIGPSVIARSAVLPVDFHGDAAFFDGDVHVATCDWMLPRNAVSAGREHGGDAEFVLAAGTASAASHADRVSGLLGLGADPAARGLPRSGALTLDDASVVAPIPASLPLRLLRLGRAANLDAAATEEAKNHDVSGAVPDAALSRQLNRAHAGAIPRDQVVRIRRREFTGHVFNLHAENGLIVAEGVYTGNCRHSIRPIDKFRASRAGWLDASGKLRPVATPRGGHADAGFRA
jgi:SPP1 gp7 family putative phage head morphogenesis protein